MPQRSAGAAWNNCCLQRGRSPRSAVAPAASPSRASWWVPRWRRLSVGRGRGSRKLCISDSLSRGLPRKHHGLARHGARTRPTAAPRSVVCMSDVPRCVQQCTGASRPSEPERQTWLRNAAFFCCMLHLDAAISSPVDALVQRQLEEDSGRIRLVERPKLCCFGSCKLLAKELVLEDTRRELRHTETRCYLPPPICAQLAGDWYSAQVGRLHGASLIARCRRRYLGSLLDDLTRKDDGHVSAMPSFVAFYMSVSPVVPLWPSYPAI